jgi:hypothetical protein
MTICEPGDECKESDDFETPQAYHANDQKQGEQIVTASFMPFADVPQPTSTPLDNNTE